MLKLFKLCLVVGCSCLSTISHAATVQIKEVAGSVRFEQYTGGGASLVLWRMPTPGVSTFPGTSCVNASIPTAEPVQTARFIAMYLFAKNSGDQIFYYVDTATCRVVSFGIDG